jgi:hypothetical protein
MGCLVSAPRSEFDAVTPSEPPQIVMVLGGLMQPLPAPSLLPRHGRQRSLFAEAVPGQKSVDDENAQRSDRGAQRRAKEQNQYKSSVGVPRRADEQRECGTAGSSAAERC